ncbi:S16 family serine protease [Sulfuriroseicoccus oceanibius]|uniref:Lon proteolytic domain-containing protein n=1 Tax=Sulfuriroseicoccus oceanibius TaxID=2707525 RepID=A0A6B3LBR0_9BACT|nr:S16 family serine protease [Sulfuriroseicoccus oceanibius]QQL45320.1 hypothetical protein G3M56_001655 [Sulfuriroseicoccus oceanibius]
MTPQRFVSTVVLAGLVATASPVVHAQSSAALSAESGEAQAGLKQNLNKLTALLVADMGGGQLGGEACDLIITAVPGHSGDPISIKFNQEVGDMMSTGLESARRAVLVRHPAAPTGQTLEISFADKFTPKDGPSASLAVAMLFESLITGDAFRKDCAVTGDITSDGEVRPIGGLPAKIRAAAKKECGVLCFPKDNENELGDMIVDGDMRLLMQVQVVSVATLDDALAVAKQERPDGVAAAMSALEELLTKAKAEGGAVLKTPESKRKLAGVLEKMPNHMSARAIQLYTQGKLPRSYSLIGSLTRLDNAIAELNATFDAASSNQRGAAWSELISPNTLDNVYLRARKNLGQIRTKLHPDVKRYENAVARYIQLLSKIPHIVETKERASVRRYLNECRRAGDQVDSERKSLLSRPEIRDLMM